jgi:hypothetical protein
VNTRGYGGRTLSKKIIVETNDRKNSTIKLEILGKVERFAAIIPMAVRLNGQVGKPVGKTVRIIPEEKYPFTVTGVKAQKGEFIQFKLDEALGSEKKGYLLTVENTRKEKGRYRDTIVLKTTSKIRPELEIRVWGNVYESRSARAAEKDENLQKFIEAIKRQEKKGKTGVSADPEDSKRFLEQLNKARQKER